MNVVAESLSPRYRTYAGMSLLGVLFKRFPSTFLSTVMKLQVPRRAKDTSAVSWLSAFQALLRAVAYHWKFVHNVLLSVPIK